MKKETCISLIIMISQDIIITICSARHYDESSVLQPRTQTAIGGYHRLIQVYAIIWSYIHCHHDVSFAFEVISVYLSTYNHRTFQGNPFNTTN